MISTLLSRVALPKARLALPTAKLFHTQLYTPSDQFLNFIGLKRLNFQVTCPLSADPENLFITKIDVPGLRDIEEVDFMFEGGKDDVIFFEAEAPIDAMDCPGTTARKYRGWLSPPCKCCKVSTDYRPYLLDGVLRVYFHKVAKKSGCTHPKVGTTISRYPRLPDQELEHPLVLHGPRKLHEQQVTEDKVFARVDMPGMAEYNELSVTVEDQMVKYAARIYHDFHYDGDDYPRSYSGKIVSPFEFDEDNVIYELKDGVFRVVIKR